MVSNFDSNIQNILTQEGLKWLFVGGKGGVGKTTVSSSVSLLMSQIRKGKVLIISTDPAHNLSDAFDQKIGSTPTLINGTNNLFGIELDPKMTEENSKFNEVLGYNIDNSTSEILTELTQSIPGIDEAMCLGFIMKLVAEQAFELVIFDTAPTGHTMRLLNFPSLLNKGLEKLISYKEKFNGIMSSVSGMLNQNIGDVYDKLFVNLNALKENIEKINEQFQDHSKTTFLAVCIPEFLSIFETERLINDLFNFDIDIRNIVINQVIFDCGNNCKMCNARRNMQKKYIDQAKSLYEDFHITTVPLQENEIRGVQMLSEFSKMLYQPELYK